MIERVRIQGYKSLHDVDVKLEPLTVLIGRSGTGKSNFVRALRAVRDVLAAPMSPGPGQTSLIQQLVITSEPFGRPSDLSVELDIRVDRVGLLTYAATLSGGVSGGVRRERLTINDRVVFDNRDRQWLVTPSAVVPLPAPRGLLLGSLSAVPEAILTHVIITRKLGIYDFTGSVLQDGTSLDAGPSYGGTGEHALAVAGRLLDATLERPGEWPAIVNSLRALNGRISTVQLILPTRDKLQVGYDIGRRVLTASVAEESEGFRRYLAHMLALYQTPPKQTLVFEHPESGIHPGALRALASEFKRHVAEKRGQVILTTHSPQFLDQFDAENVRAVVMEDGQTRIGRVAEEQFEAVRTSLMSAGDLLTIDPARLDEPAPAAAGA